MQILILKISCVFTTCMGLSIGLMDMAKSYCHKKDNIEVANTLDNYSTICCMLMICGLVVGLSLAYILF